MNESKLKLIPAVLLAIAGVLVDATFRSDAYRDRIWAQIALWLATSLQEVSDDNASMTFILIHGAFFLSLVSAGYQAFLVTCRWNTLTDSFRADYSRFLAPSMTLPLFYSWIYMIPPLDMPSSWMYCFALYCLSLISLCGWRWTTLRRRRVSQDLVGIPTVESMPVFSTSSRSLEEQAWMEWSPSEVLSWINSLEGDEWSFVCCQLAPERVPGSVLDTLTVGELRTMGLPYGTAMLLFKKISELTASYPLSARQPDRYRNSQRDEREVDEWFGDSRVSHSVQMQQALTSTMEGTNTNLASSLASTQFPGELNDETIQKAKELFRDQFGLELPEIKVRHTAASAPPLNEEAGRYAEDLPPTERTVSEPRTVATSSVAPERETENNVPVDLLDFMPPHVREVAEQRPDLVQMLWKQKQQCTSATSLGLSRIHQLRMQDEAYAGRRIGAQAAAEIAGIPAARGGDQVGSIAEEENMMPDQNSDGERTVLLRKRAARPPKYAAIR